MSERDGTKSTVSEPEVCATSSTDTICGKQIVSQVHLVQARLEDQLNKNNTKQNLFAKNLAALMEEHGIGVREAAKIAEVPPSTIQNWRSGTLPTNYAAIKRLAKAFSTSFSYLLTGEDETRPPNSPVSVSEIFEDGGELFDGYAQITIRKLIPKRRKP